MCKDDNGENVEGFDVPYMKGKSQTKVQKQLFQIARKFFIKLENFENLICLVIAGR